MNGLAIDPIVLSATIGLGIAVVGALGLIKWHKQILSAIGLVLKAIFTWTGFFWIVNLSCMAYSAQNAGYIFGLYESTGVIVGVCIDGLIIAFTQTMLAAKARGEYRRAAQILMFIVFCCLLSTVGNLAHNLHTDVGTQTDKVWFASIIPYVVSTMPLFLIALAWVADLKVNPLEREDPKVYKANEDKQIEFQQIQIESNEKRAELQTRVIAVEALRRRNNALRRGKVPGSFRWFWEKAIDASEVIAGLSTQLKPLFSSQIEEMKRELETLRQEKEDYLAHVEQVNAEKMTHFRQDCRTFINQLIEEIRVDLSGQNEQYRLALGQQYDQDITALTRVLNGRVETGLSDLKMTISQDVTALNDAFNQAIIASRKPAKSNNVIEMTPEVEIVVKRYPIVSSWLSRTERSVTLQEIIDGTGHTFQMVHKRAKDKTFRRTKGEGLYRLDSVIRWLRSAPLPRPKEEIDPEDKEQEISPITQTNGYQDTDEIEAVSQEIPVTDSPDNNVIAERKEISDTDKTEVISQEITAANGPDIEGHSDRKETSESSSSTGNGVDKLAMTVAAMRENPAVTEQELMVVLGLKRPASTRFWKVKAQELLDKEQPSEEPVLEYATA